MSSTQALPLRLAKHPALADLEPQAQPDVRLWVVAPAYNEAVGIGETLDALAGQTDLDFALVVVDNASTDGTADVVREFASRAPTPTACPPQTGSWPPSPRCSSLRWRAGEAFRASTSTRISPSGT